MLGCPRRDRNGETPIGVNATAVVFPDCATTHRGLLIFSVQLMSSERAHLHINLKRWLTVMNIIKTFEKPDKRIYFLTACYTLSSSFSKIFQERGAGNKNNALN